MHGLSRTLPSVRAFSTPAGALLTHSERTHGGVAQIDSELCETMEEAAMLRDQLVLEHRGAKKTHRLNFPQQLEGNTPAVRARAPRSPISRGHPSQSTIRTAVCPPHASFAASGARNNRERWSSGWMSA
jgi:hypothetical protein